MKKLVSILLTLVMVLGLTTAAFATEGNEPEASPSTTTQPLEDTSTVTIKKVYEIANADTTSPAETFKFTIENTAVTDAAAGVTAKDMPTPTINTVEYAVGEAGSAEKKKEIEVTLPEYKSVGIYTYTITETDGKMAGVTYYKDPITLVVTVTNGADGNLVRTAAVYTGEGDEKTKPSKITNTYSAGSLSIKKEVTGNLGDTSKYFRVTVTLTGVEGKTYADSYAVTGGTKIENGNNNCASSSITIGQEKVFYLKNGETITIANLPYGVTYTVQEADYTEAGYEAEYVFSDATSKKIDSARDTVTITNNKGVVVDTGITMDSLPFILILGVALVGVTGMLIKRRLSADR